MEETIIAPQNGDETVFMEGFTIKMWYGGKKPGGAMCQIKDTLHGQRVAPTKMPKICNLQ